MVNRKLLYILSYLYLLVPLILFLLGWVKPIIAIPVVILACYCFIKCIGNMLPTSLHFAANRKKLIAIIAILFVYVFLSGIGGFVWQNTWDHMYRNAIFSDLVVYDWPVVNLQGDHPLMLCYYIGFWLPAALVAKLFGSMLVGYVFQLLWGFVGCVLAFMLMSQWLKKISFVTLLLLIFFSGLDIIPYLVNGVDINFFQYPYAELTNLPLNASSNTNLLFWLYNQTIPFWVGFMLILLNTNRNYLFFNVSLLFLFSPFPVVALLPAIIYLQLAGFEIDKGNIKKTVLHFVKSYATIPNLAAFLILLIIALFYSSNLATNKLRISSHLFAPHFKFAIVLFSFLILEYIIYILFIYKKIRKDYFFLILLSTMIFFSFFQLGNSNDLAWRTVIPSSFYLMLLVARESLTMKPASLKCKLLIGVLLIGSINPILEMARTVVVTKECIEQNEPFRSNRLQSVFLPNGCYENFIGKSDSFFYKYVITNH